MNDAGTLRVSDLSQHAWLVVAERPEGPLGDRYWAWHLDKASRDTFLMDQAIGRIVMAHRHDGDGVVRLVATLARNGGAW